jgi:hypothetical protein
MSLESERDWIRFLTSWAVGAGWALTTILPDLRRSEWYPVARGQYLFGARFADLDRMLRRAADEVGLVPNSPPSTGAE